MNDGGKRQVIHIVTDKQIALRAYIGKNYVMFLPWVVRTLSDNNKSICWLELNFVIQDTFLVLWIVYRYIHIRCILYS